MGAWRAYTRRQWVRAVNLCAVIGWLLISIPFAEGMSDGTILSFLGIMIWAAVLGLPIALGVCWIVAAPILKHVMRRPVTWASAGFWGFVVSAAIASASVGVGRSVSLFISMSGSYSLIGGGDKTIQVNGILTDYGWLALGQRTILFVLAGVVIALFVRAVIGPAGAQDHDWTSK